MLLRHDQALLNNDAEIGRQEAFRELAGRGPIGQEIKDEIAKLEEADKRSNRRISRNHRIVTRIDKRQGEIANDISWIKQHLKERDGKE